MASDDDVDDDDGGDGDLGIVERVAGPDIKNSFNYNGGPSVGDDDDYQGFYHG